MDASWRKPRTPRLPDLSVCLVHSEGKPAKALESRLELPTWKNDLEPRALVCTFLNGMLNGDHAIGTIHVVRNVLSAALTRAMRKEILTGNVVRLATLPPLDPQRNRP